MYNRFTSLPHQIELSSEPYYVFWSREGIGDEREIKGKLS